MLLHDTKARPLAAPTDDQLRSDETQALEATEGSLAPPRRVGPWRLGAQLGRGGLGVVHLAHPANGGPPVALKLLNLRAQLRPHSAERLLLEASLTRLLTHPGIVTIVDAGFDQGPCYVAMELLAGGNLSELLCRRGPLPPIEALELIAKVSRALHHAHCRGVIHRDIKPANILLRGPLDPVITDFGLARARLLSSYLGFSRPGDVLGTPAFMAPEQIEARNRALGAHSDIYALGATLYCLLTGEPPFSQRSTGALLVAVLDRPPPLVSERRPGLSPEIDALVSRCLAKDPAARPSSAAQLADACDSLARLSRHPHSAQRAKSGRLTRRAPTRGRRPKAAWALTLVLACSALLLARRASLGVAAPHERHAKARRELAMWLCELSREATTPAPDARRRLRARGAAELKALSALGGALGEAAQRDLERLREAPRRPASRRMDPSLAATPMASDQ